MHGRSSAGRWSNSVEYACSWRTVRRSQMGTGQQCEYFRARSGWTPRRSGTCRQQPTLLSLGNPPDAAVKSPSESRGILIQCCEYYARSYIQYCMWMCCMSTEHYFILGEVYRLKVMKLQHNWAFYRQKIMKSQHNCVFERQIKI